MEAAADTQGARVVVDTRPSRSPPDPAAQDACVTLLESCSGVVPCALVCAHPPGALLSLGRPLNRLRVGDLTHSSTTALIASLSPDVPAQEIVDVVWPVLGGRAADIVSLLSSAVKACSSTSEGQAGVDDDASDAETQVRYHLPLLVCFMTDCARACPTACIHRAIGGRLLPIHHCFPNTCLTVHFIRQ